MSEFLLELYSEEIPPQLQISAREELKQTIKKSFEQEQVKYSALFDYSSPTRLIICVEGLAERIKIDSKEIKGPKVGVIEDILNSFIRAHNVSKKDVFEKEIDKGKFYFIKTKPKEILTKDLLTKIVLNAIASISWKKSMKWSDNDLLWGRPLRSILAIYNKKLLTFTYGHLKSTDTVIIEQNLVNKFKKIKNFKKFKVTSAVMKCAKKDAIFLHCLPRGPEVSNDVFLGKQSKVFQQALNRIYVQKSILLYCFEKLR